jgi:hypothetical protein
MPVRRVTAREMLGGRSLVMTANPAIARAFAKLRAQGQADSTRTRNRDAGGRKEPAASDERTRTD